MLENALTTLTLHLILWQHHHVLHGFRDLLQQHLVDRHQLAVTLLLHAPVHVQPGVVQAEVMTTLLYHLCQG